MSLRLSSSLSSCPRMPSSMFMPAGDRKLREQKARSAPMPPLAFTEAQLLYAFTYSGASADGLRFSGHPSVNTRFTHSVRTTPVNLLCHAGCHVIWTPSGQQGGHTHQSEVVRPAAGVLR